MGHPQGRKLGLGITFQLSGDLTCLQVSVTLYVTDATRCESLGPALAALVLSWFAVEDVHLYGDSLMVVYLLRYEVVISRLTFGCAMQLKWR